MSVLDKNPSELNEKEMKAFYSQIGVLYQEGALLNSMSVGENLGLPLEQHSDLPAMLIEHIVRMKLHQVNLDNAYENILPN